jgi:hypothetical protein
MAKDAQSEDRFADPIAELRTVCTSSFALAFFLAHQPDSNLLPALERELERFRKMVDELVAIHRGRNLGRSGSRAPSPPHEIPVLAAGLLASSRGPFPGRSPPVEQRRMSAPGNLPRFPGIDLLRGESSALCAMPRRTVRRESMATKSPGGSAAESEADEEVGERDEGEGEAHRRARDTGRERNAGGRG